MKKECPLLGHPLFIEIVTIGTYKQFMNKDSYYLFYLSDVRTKARSYFPLFYAYIGI